MRIFQKEILLEKKSRGFHLITREIMSKCPEITEFNVAMCNIFVKHTSCSLTINENASPDVRVDLESSFNRLAPENNTLYHHIDEGADDMPAHVKSSMIGASLNIPISNGELNLGTWQGIYLCEHRNHGGSRKLVISIIGE